MKKMDKIDWGGRICEGYRFEQKYKTSVDIITDECFVCVNIFSMEVFLFYVLF